MSEYITDRDLSSIGGTNMAAYAGLTITDGGVCLQRTELPQAVTVAGALNSDTNNFADGSTKQITSVDITDAAIHPMMGDVDKPGHESASPDVKMEDLTPGAEVESDLFQQFEVLKSNKQRIAELLNDDNSDITDAAIHPMMGDVDKPGHESASPDVKMEDLTPGAEVESDLFQQFEVLKSNKQRIAELLNDDTASDSTNTASISTNNYLDGPTYSVNWPESTDTTPQVYKLVLVDDGGESKTGGYRLVPVIDATNDSSQNNYLDGPTYSVNWPESTDTTPQVYKLVLVDDGGESKTGGYRLVPVIDATNDSSQNNYLDGPTYSLNYPESTDTTPKAYKMVLVEDGDESNPGHYKLVPVIDTTNDSSANNYLDGPTYSLNYPESTDTTPKAYKMVLVEDGDESNPGHYKLVPVIDTTNDSSANNYLDGPTYSLNYPESTDTTPKAYKMVLVEDGDESNPGHYKLVPVIDTTNDSSANNYLDGPTYSLNYPESTDTTPKAYKMVLVEDGDESNPGHYKLVPVIDTTNDSSANNYLDGPTYSLNYPESTDTTPKEYKLVLVDGEPLKLIPVIDGSMAFINTVDAETEAVTSVQVACAEDGGWRTIGTLNNPDGIDWKYQVGNLTGSGTASVVWHAQELGALGVWTDGTDNWTAIDGWFDGNWTMFGCGDFDGDGKDSVLMSYGGFLYAAGIDAPLANLGGLSWAGWEFGAVGDFAGDGKDDVVLFHKELGCVVLLADGNTADYTSIGQLDTSDWSIAGAGDFDGDGKVDLLVRQTSTGIAGAYASADMSKWSTVTTDYLLA